MLRFDLLLTGNANELSKIAIVNRPVKKACFFFFFFFWKCQAFRKIILVCS